MVLTFNHLVHAYLNPTWTQVKKPQLLPDGQLVSLSSSFDSPTCDSAQNEWKIMNYSALYTNSCTSWPWFLFYLLQMKVSSLSAEWLHPITNYLSKLTRKGILWSRGFLSVRVKSLGLCLKLSSGPYRHHEWEQRRPCQEPWRQSPWTSGWGR